MINFSELKKSAIADLKDTILQLGTVTAKKVTPLKFKLSQESLSEASREIEKLCPKNQKVIYEICLKNYQDEVYNCYSQLKVSTKKTIYSEAKNKRTTKTVYPSMMKLRKEFPELKVSKLNDYNENSIYVGSSNEFSKRFKEHMGIGGSNSTYSLHLKKVLHSKEWANQLQIEVFVLPLEGATELLKQTLEDSLWKLKRPSFGKRGGK